MNNIKYVETQKIYADIFLLPWVLVQIKIQVKKKNDFNNKLYMALLGLVN